MKIAVYLIIVSSCFVWNGCIAFGPHIIDVTNDPAWWGQLAKDEVLQTRQDVRLYSGELLSRGTRLQCVKLVRFYTTEDSGYTVWAEILDGEFKGRIVAISGYVFGSPDYKGRLRYVTDYFEPIK